MDLNILNRLFKNKSLFAVETINLIYNAVTTILILFLFNRMHSPLLMIGERAIIVVATFALVYFYNRCPNRFTAFIRIAAQMGLLAYWYPDTFEFNRLFPNLDNLFASAEQFLFNCQPSVTFSEHFHSMWFSEPFNLGYFSYYPMIFIVAVYYFVFHFKLFDKVSFIIVTSFFIYYLIYIFVPVAGPQFYFPAIGMDSVMAQHFPAIGDYFNHNNILIPGPGYNHGFFYDLVEASQEVGERPTAAFPSSHVGISSIIMILAYKGNKKLSYFLFPFYVLLCCATVYIQAHYLIDVFAGLISAVIIYNLSRIMYDKWFSSIAFKKLCNK